MCDNHCFPVVAPCVPGCAGATSDNPPRYISCWRWTWSRFSPAATQSDDWRGRISWKTVTHAAACYIWNMLRIMITPKWRCYCRGNLQKNRNKVSLPMCCVVCVSRLWHVSFLSATELHFCPEMIKNTAVSLPVAMDDMCHHYEEHGIPLVQCLFTMCLSVGADCLACVISRLLPTWSVGLVRYCWSRPLRSNSDSMGRAITAESRLPSNPLPLCNSLFFLHVI